MNTKLCLANYFYFIFYMDFIDLCLIKKQIIFNFLLRISLKSYIALLQYLLIKFEYKHMPILIYDFYRVQK